MTFFTNTIGIEQVRESTDTFKNKTPDQIKKMIRHDDCANWDATLLIGVAMTVLMSELEEIQLSN